MFEAGAPTETTCWTKPRISPRMEIVRLRRVVGDVCLRLRRKLARCIEEGREGSEGVPPAIRVVGRVGAGLGEGAMRTEV